MHGAGLGQAAIALGDQVGHLYFVAGTGLEPQAFVGPVVTRSGDFDHIAELARQRGGAGSPARVGGGDHDHRWRCAGAQVVSEEQAVVVRQQVELARRSRGAGDQCQGFAKAQGGIVRCLGKHLYPGTVCSTPVAGAFKLCRGLFAGIEHLAGHGENVGADGAGRPFDLHIVGVERAADDRFSDVRVADEGFAGAGIRVDLGVRPPDAAQERPQGTFEHTAEIARSTDADVTGDIDCAPTGRGDVDCFDTVGVGDHIGASLGNRDPQADAREALLVTIDGVLAGKRRFDTGDINIQLIAAVAHCRNRGFSQVPEHLRWPVIGEHQRQGIIVDARFGQQRTHIGRWYRDRHPRTRRS
ncbi:hypothetical protein D3C84_565300 [compost metagenome]